MFRVRFSANSIESEKSPFASDFFRRLFVTCGVFTRYFFVRSESARPPSILLVHPSTSLPWAALMPVSPLGSSPAQSGAWPQRKRKNPLRRSAWPKRIHANRFTRKPFFFLSAHTSDYGHCKERRIYKGCLQNRQSFKFKGFSSGIPREQALLRKSNTPGKFPEKWSFLSLLFYNAPSLHTLRAPETRFAERCSVRDLQIDSHESGHLPLGRHSLQY